MTAIFLRILFGKKGGCGRILPKKQLKDERRIIIVTLSYLTIILNSPRLRLRYVVSYVVNAFTTIPQSSIIIVD